MLNFPLAFLWVGLKPIGHFAFESFDQGVGFSWRAYRNLGTSYTCVDFTMGLFVDTVGTTTPFTGFDEAEITNLAVTNAEWLPYLADKGMRFVHYPANRVRRQFGLDQDIPNAISFLMKSPTSVQPFLQPTAFEFWSQRFTVVTLPSSLREGLCTPAMHGYWQAVMTSFEKELMGSRGFSLVLPNGLRAIISANPRLLLPSKSALAYARKQSRSTIFEWDEEKKGWYWHTDDYPSGWEKKVKVTNISVPIKKGPAKLKSTSKSKPATPLPSTNAPPSSRTRGSKRKTTPHPAFATERRVSYLKIFFFNVILTFLWLILTCVLTFLFNIISCSLFLFQSKHEEDASVTRPILLDEPEFEVHLLSFLLPPLLSLHVLHLPHAFV